MSEHGIDKLHKMIEYILFNEEVNAEEILKGLIDVNAVAITLNAWCLSNAQDQLYSAICAKSYDLLDEVVSTMLRYLMMKQLDEKVRLGNDVISKILVVIRGIVDAIKFIVENSLIIQEEKVLCKVKKPIAIADKIVEKGYITVIPINLAAVLTVLGYVEPIRVQAPLFLKS
ncbi:MAG: hypothetical protein QXL96_00645 [Ignisphaera sp.]